MLDNESGRVLNDPPGIHNTVTDFFSVKKIDGNFVSLKGRHQDEVVRLHLPSDILPLIELNDCLDLVLGNTSEKWVVLEAGQVYPQVD
jgi:p-aminobenzoyl-glutamate transporter AbgT